MFASNKNTLFYVPAFLWALFILIICMLSPSYIPNVEFNLISPDKLVHAILFGILLWLLLWAFKKHCRFRKSRVLLLFVLVTVYGTLIEILQFLLKNGRQADIADILANTFGAFLVCLYYLFFDRSLISGN